MSFCFLILLLLTANVFSTLTSRMLEGYSSGYLADCPGSTGEAFIAKNSLKHLSIVVRGINASYSWYNYFQVNELAKDPNLDFKKKTMLYVGGFLFSPTFPGATHVADAYKKIGYNVLLLDTNWFGTVEYPRACRLMRPVGMHASQMIVELIKNGMDPKKLEMVSLSLGCHTAGFIAKSYRNLTGSNITKITALDPAGPCFRNRAAEDRLDKTDADFVEVVHTNIDNFGMAAAVGHIDYYVNGGEYQPGGIYWLFCPAICCHVRAQILWITALKYRNEFIAIQCDSVQQARDKDCFDRQPSVTNVLGFNVNKTIEGIFYLATNNISPYFLGANGLKKEYDFYLSVLNSLNKSKIIKM